MNKLVKLKDIAQCDLGKMLDQKKNKGKPQVYLGNVAVRWGGFNIDYNQKMLFEDSEIERFQIRKGDIVLCEGGEPGRCAIWTNEEPIYFQKALHRIRVKEPNDNWYLYYYLSHYVKTGQADSLFTGTTIKHLPRQVLLELPIYLPNPPQQKKISSILKSLDDKIENNRKINENLEQQAQALFKSWFVDFEPFRDQPFVESELGMIPEGWRVVGLSSIADFINGLAMQNYRPTNGEKGMPVLKIKELGQGGFDANSEYCSPTMVDDKYHIHNGDIVFSWSDTLMVKIWCGEECGLNQHLFNVVPKGFSKWFAYQWTNYHLDNFIRIAKDKAVTMGHIKRGELDKAMVLIPNENDMVKMDSIMNPIYHKIVLGATESHRLSHLRDTLLPKLMSGEIKL